jgi:CRP-like cAMP-binding protein
MFFHSQYRISGLLSIELLSDLPDYLPQSLRDQARPATVKKRKTLYCINDPVTSIYYVRRGELEAVRYSPEGGKLGHGAR